MPSAGRINILHHKPGKDVVTVILPGYNQDGAALHRVLAPGLTSSAVLTYNLPRWGFDQTKLVHRLAPVMDYRRVIIYAESAGAQDAAALLRLYPALRVQWLILNAGVSGRRALNAGAFLPIFRVLPSWLPITRCLRRAQRKAVANSPKLDVGVDEAAARYAEQLSLQLTGRQAIGELRRMHSTPRVRPGEFEGRVHGLVYMGMGATDGGSNLAERDAFVRLRRSCAEWGQATRVLPHIITPPQWADLHVPTPERSQPVIQVLRRAIG